MLSVFPCCFFKKTDNAQSVFQNRPCKLHFAVRKADFRVETASAEFFVETTKAFSYHSDMYASRKYTVYR
jgi:hypothetical protein